EAPSALEIPPQGLREAETDWVEHRVDTKGNCVRGQELDGLGQALQTVRSIGDGDDLRTPIDCPFAIRRVDAQYELRPRGNGIGDPARIEAVDRDPEPAVHERLDRRTDAHPSLPGVATEIDHIRSLAPISLRERQQRIPGEARRVVDLRDDLDVELP